MNSLVFSKRFPSMLWSTSPTGEPTHNSQRLLEYVGASLEEFVSRGWVSFIHPDDREETAEGILPCNRNWRVIQRNKPRANVQTESTDGIKREGNLCVIPTGRSFSGMASRLTSSERKERAEDHLRDTRIKLRHSVENRNRS